MSTLAELKPVALVRYKVKDQTLRGNMTMHAWYFRMPDGSEVEPDAFLTARITPKLQMVDGDTGEALGPLESRPSMMKKLLGMTYS
jgi:hypothetical protein